MQDRLHSATDSSSAELESAIAPAAPESKQTAAQQAATQIVQDTKALTKHWRDSKGATIAVGAGVVAGGFASSAKHYSEAFVDGLITATPGTIHDSLTGIFTTASGATAFALTFLSNFKLWNRLTRSQSDRVAFKKNKLILLTALISACVSAKVNWDAFSQSSNLARFTAAALRGVSAFGNNAFFMQMLKKDYGGDKAIPEIDILKQAQQHLLSLPDDLLIEKLNQSDLFTHLFANSKTDAVETLHDIYNALLYILNHQAPASVVAQKTQPATKRKRNTAYALAAVSTFPFLRAGQSLFTEAGKSAMWTVGLVPFGVTSWSVNIAMAVPAILSTMDSLLQTERPKNYEDFCKLVLKILPKLLPMLGYAVPNAGLAMKYPFPAQDSTLGAFEALFNLVISLAVANMTLDNFYIECKLGANEAYKHLLEGARKHCLDGMELNSYYEVCLEDSAEKEIFAELVRQYLRWALGSYKDFFNALDDTVRNELFNGPMRDRFKTFQDKKSAAMPADETKEAKDSAVVDVLDQAEDTSWCPATCFGLRQRKHLSG